jgi:hypothetical protein
VAVADPESPGDVVVAGLADGAGSRLLPRGFERRLAGGAPTGETVRLGKLEAYRYAKLTPAGGKPVELYVTPLRSKVAAIACLGGAIGDACEHAAAGLRLRGGTQARPLGPSASYAKAIRAAITRLAADRTHAQKQLRAARTSPAQVAPARAVATAYDRAAKAVDRAAPGPLEARAQPALRAALVRARDAYRGLAQAAKTRSRYDSARKAAARADAAVAAAVKDLQALGYDVG